MVSQWTTDKQKESGIKKAESWNILSEKELYGKQEPLSIASIKLVYLNTAVQGGLLW